MEYPRRLQLRKLEEPVPEHDIDMHLCGPNMTGFLADLINNSNRWIRSEWARKGRIRRYEGISWMKKNGMLLDWWTVKYHTTNCPTNCSNCGKAYEICGECVHDHWIGNFMYGYLSRVLGIPDWMSDLAGSLVQLPGGGGGYRDPSWDVAGYKLARKVHDALMKSSSSVNLCSVLKSDLKLWNKANDTSATGWLYPKPHVTGQKTCAKCSEPLLPPVRTTFPGGNFSPANKWPSI